MGWSGGTDIFDNVATSLLKVQDDGYDADLPNRHIENILNNLLFELEKQDWDNHQESNYWDHPVVGKILGNEFEDEDE